VRIVLLYYLLF